MISTHTQKLLDLKCEALKLTITQQNRFIPAAFDKQKKSGLQGPDMIKAYVVASLFDFFKSRVKTVHDGALEVINACDLSENLDIIPDYIDAKIRPFVDLIHTKVLAIALPPFSREEPTIAAAYARLKGDFDFKSGVAIKHQKKEKPMSKSYHVHGLNLGQVGDGNKQELHSKTGEVNMTPDGGVATIENNPKEKTGVLKSLIFPLIVGIISAVTAGIFHLLKK